MPGYAKHRVFFADEPSAIRAGYRPCGTCMKNEYAAWKQGPGDADESAYPWNVLPPETLVDVSHVVEHDMVTYRGLPAPIICDYLSREASRERYAPGTEFNIGRIDMVGNTGTYVDSPFHRYADGMDLADLPLTSLANLPCVVARIPEGRGRAIDTLGLRESEIKGAAVLVHTGWSKHWRTEQYFEGHPHLTEGLAERLVAAGAALVGIDSFNIDDIDTNARPVHSVLLRAGIPIAEHLRGLSRVPVRGTRFFAVPVKVRAFGTFPVRAFALA
jgi:kynurenine formamidase